LILKIWVLLVLLKFGSQIMTILDAEKC
jgi:hypothetical protein